MANPPGGKTFSWQMYHYIPSLVGATVSIIVFSILGLILSWQWVGSRSNILILVIVGTLAELGGYAGRVGSHFDNEAWGPFITQGALLLIGPLFFAATVYMLLGRTIVLAGGEDVSLIKPRWYTRVFVGADVFTLMVQSTGASIMGSMKLPLVLAGNKIVIAGLSLQVATFVFFLVAAIDFQIRMKRKSSSSRTASDGDWKKMLCILYTVSALILFRCIFRLIEYALGNAAYLASHEWTLYAFDTVPMFFTVTFLLVLQPTRYVAKEYTRSGDSSDGLKIGGSPRK